MFIHQLTSCLYFVVFIHQLRVFHSGYSPAACTLQRSFTMDDRVAWVVITIPQAVMNGETVDEWFSLSGRLGDGLEGSVNIVMTLTVSVQLHISLSDYHIFVKFLCFIPVKQNVFWFDFSLCYTHTRTHTCTYACTHTCMHALQFVVFQPVAVCSVVFQPVAVSSIVFQPVALLAVSSVSPCITF